jgi:hypothetical protein
MTMNRKRNQGGFVVTAELLLVSTVLVLGLLTGMTKLRDQTIAELSDSGSAIGAINQSYEVVGTEWEMSTGATIAEVSGFAFDDAGDPATPGQVGGDGLLVHYAPAPVPSESDSSIGEDGVGGTAAP